ncbi:MAG: endoglucanase [Dokdonia sp.]|jgi:endoglucanase
MKKITLLLFLALLGGVTMQAQNLLTNGDFEGGMVDWTGNAFNIQEDGGNSFNFADVETAGNAFDVNLSQILGITEGQTYILTFDASSDGNRTVIAGIGLNEAPFTAATETVDLTTETQTYTLTLTAGGIGIPNSRVLFDMGAETGVVVIDNVSLELEDSMSTFDDGLLDNGDFEQGMVVWTGNAFNVQEDGGNNFNFANVETAGNSFDVNLSQILSITDGETYVLTFDASSDGDRTMIAGIGLNESPFTSATETVDLTTETQTYTLTLTAAGIGIPNSRVLFDMGADTGVVVIDNVSLFVDGGEENMLPLTAAPTPPNRAPESVFSLFSNAYTPQPAVVFGAFGVGTQDITTIQIEGDDTQQIGLNQPAAEFLLVDWGLPVDNSAMTHFHMDFWIQTDLSTGLIANPKWSNHVGDAGETSAFQLTNPVNTFGEWISIDIPIADFDADDPAQQRDALRQFVLTVAGADGGDRTIFIDNLYLHQNTVLSTEEFTSIDVSVYPNPSSERWTVKTTSDVITTVAVYDLLGRRVSQATPNANSFDINASNLRTGIYLATITTNNGQETIKLIKR